MKQVVCILTPGKANQDIIKLQEKGDDVEVIVLFVGRKKERIVFDTWLEHCQSDTHSQMIIRGVLFDEARATIKGGVRVLHNAQHIQTRLEERIVLLGDKANAEVVPAMEVETHEVKASHAAVVGKVNEDQMFYLMSRGLSAKQAKKTIAAGFFQPVLDRIEDKTIKNKLVNII